MTDLCAFAVTRKWPARHPDRIQLCSLPTPNGVKVSIMLEETGLPYEPHLVRFDASDQLSPEFLSLSPNNKIPAILDPDGPGGKPLLRVLDGQLAERAWIMGSDYTIADIATFSPDQQPDRLLRRGRAGADRRLHSRHASAHEGA